MTENKPIYHAWNINPWKGHGEISAFHRFANQRDIAVYFWSWGTYLLCNYKIEIFALLIWISNISIYLYVKNSALTYSVNFYFSG